MTNMKEIRDMARQLGIRPTRMEKAELIRAIQRAEGTFRVADLQRECPGVSLDLIRATLKKLRTAGRVECLGRGQSAERNKKARW